MDEKGATDKFLENKLAPDDAPSKSQRKREMKALGILALRLTELSKSHIERLPGTDLKAAILTAQSLTRGNAKRRQIQYISKLLKTADLAPITAILDRLDAGSVAHIKLFHQLEKWREALTAGADATSEGISEGTSEGTPEGTLEETLEEICQRYPNTDRQHLRRLARNAIAAKQAGRNHTTHLRKIFRYLKQLTE